MSDAPEESVKLNPETRKVKVVLDTSPQIAAKDEKIAELNKKIGEQENIIKAMLVRDKAEFTLSEPKKAPSGGDTVSYEQNAQSNRRIDTYQLDIANSDIEPSWIKGKNAEDAIAQTEQLAKIGNVGCQRILSKLCKRALKSGIDIEFEGESRLLLKHDLPISEFDSTEVKQQKQAYNQKLRENRLKWRNLNGDD
jgi:hypothetical protein